MFKNRIIYISVIIMLVAFTGIYSHKTVYTALYAFLMMPVISFAFLVVRRIVFNKYTEISENMENEVIRKGECTKYIVSITNKGFLSYSGIKINFKKNSVVYISEGNENDFFVLPHEKKEIICSLCGARRGRFETNSAALNIYDFLKLFRFKIKIKGSLSLKVLPEIIRFENLILSQKIQLDSFTIRKDFTEDREEVSETRKYLPGDGYKKIHWKTSAKRNELISKVYSSLSSRSVVIFFDNTPFPGNRVESNSEDIMIETLISLILYCTENRFLINLKINGTNGGIISSSFDELYAAVSDIVFNEEKKFCEFAEISLYGLNNASDIVVFTHSLNDSLCKSIKNIYLSGKQISAFCFSGSDEKNVRLLKSEGMNCFLITEQRRKIK